MRNRNEIIGQFRARDIDWFTHFTPCNNLQNIINYGGLMTREYLETSNVNFTKTDDMRYDGRHDSISLSISWPNSKMLNSKKNSKHLHFCVFLLDAEAIVRDFNLNFYSSNAASSMYRKYPYANRSSLACFNHMFAGMPAHSKYTSDIQAEVLCFNNIPIRYIKYAIFENQSDYYKYGHILERNNIDCIVDSSYFYSVRPAI